MLMCAYGSRIIMLLQHILIYIDCYVLLTTSSSGAESCIEDETSGHCYQIVDGWVTWSQSFSICQGVGGNLVIIESSEEQKFIADQMRKRNFTAGGLWIGSEKVYPEENRTWINGLKFSYVNWEKGQPDNPPVDENCAVIDTNDGTWHDYQCAYLLGYICENTLNLRGNEVMSYIKDNNTGHYYKIDSAKFTWNNACEICKKDGGMLIIIESEEEQKFIQDQVQKLKSRLWIGSDKLHPEQKRKWANGNKFTYVNWAEGEPGNRPYIENCAEIKTSTKMWNNYECSFLRGYICEITPPGKPESQAMIIGAVVGSVMVLLLGVLLLYCLIQKRKKYKQKNRDEAYQQTQEMKMNNIEHVYNRNSDIHGIYCTIDDL